MKGRKKGRRCPYCGHSLFFCMLSKKWHCPHCKDVDYESKKVEAGRYR